MVYHPPNASVKLFMDKFRLYSETVDMVSAKVLICGDFNIWMEDHNNLPTIFFTDMIDTFNMTNKVQIATSMGGHVLDLILTDKDCDLVHDVCVDEVCSTSPAHKLVTFAMPDMKEIEQRKVINFRLKRNFQPEISQENGEVCEHNMIYGECVHFLAKLFNDITYEEYNAMCLMIEKDFVVKDHALWFNDEILRAEKEKKKEECCWRRCRTDDAR